MTSINHIRAGHSAISAVGYRSCSLLAVLFAVTFTTLILYMYLLMCCLFDNVVSSLECIASNIRIISEKIISKDVELNSCALTSDIFRYLAEGTEKFHANQVQYNRMPCRHSISGHAEYDARVPPVRLRLSVRLLVGVRQNDRQFVVTVYTFVYFL
jgi:hypothetical protein